MFKFSRNKACSNVPHYKEQTVVYTLLDTFDPFLYEDVTTLEK